MNEAFKTIPFLPDYEISNCGRVISKERLVRYEHAVTGAEHFRMMERKLLKIYLNDRTGYKFVQPRKDGTPKNCTIHRLVAITWIPNPNNLEFVNHKDGNKHNNRIDNLEWCTNSYNHEHATKTGLKAKGDDIGISVLSDCSVLAIKRMLNEKISHNTIAKYFDVSKTTITHINTGKTWKHLTGRET